MELNYSLTENDYLQQQLYLASKDEQYKKTRKIGHIITIVLILVMGLITYSLTKKVIFIYLFFVLTIIYCCVSSIYLKLNYKLQYKKYIKRVFENNFGLVVNLKFEKDLILISTLDRNSKFKFSSFENISETKDHFFITQISDENFIIPKEKIEDVSTVRVKLKRIAQEVQIDFISDLNWEWK